MFLLVPPSLPLSLPLSLPPSLPLSLPPSLPLSLPLSFPPSLPPSLLPYLLPSQSMVQDNASLQLQLVKELVHFGDIVAAGRWAVKYELSYSQLPIPVQLQIEQKRQVSNFMDYKLFYI